MVAQHKKPAMEFRFGHIKATIWENESQRREVWFNVQIVRCYRDKDSWKETTSFGRDDLPIVAAAMNLAHVWIWGQQADQVTPDGNTN